MVGREIKLAGAARNAGTLLDPHQPVVVAKMLADFAGLREQAPARDIDLGEHRIERHRLDRGVVLEWCKQLSLPFQLLQDVGLQIGASGDIDDLEQREKSRMVIGGRSLAGEEQRPAVEILQPHQRADAFIERVLIPDHVHGSPSQWRHCAPRSARIGSAIALGINRNRPPRACGRSCC